MNWYFGFMGLICAIAFGAWLITDNRFLLFCFGFSVGMTVAAFEVEKVWK